MKNTSTSIGSVLVISLAVACAGVVIMELYGAIQRQREADRGYGR